MAQNNLFYLFKEISANTSFPRWVMTIVMIFSSMIAGATSEGGASVAFPVMTLALNISPMVARDFSFMIQSVGMTSASFTILYMKLALEYQSIIWSSIGGCLGIVFGLEFITKILPPAFSKIYFVTIWATFAFQLYLLNLDKNRACFLEIQNLKKYDWKIFILFFAGIIGGILSSIYGSGIDICIFSVLTLLFRINEKIATPTSVILMSVNTCVGFFYRGVVQMAITRESWEYFAVCIPVVVIGAPMGAFISGYLKRSVFASIIYITDLVQLITAFVIIKPWEINLLLTLLSPVIFFLFFGLFYLLINKGLKLHVSWM